MHSQWHLRNNCLLPQHINATIMAATSRIAFMINSTVTTLHNDTQTKYELFHNQKTFQFHVSSSARIILSLLMVIMIIISLFGNVLVCYIVYRKPAMRSGINLLLANLALSDLLMSFTCMPLALTFLNLQKANVNAAVCQISAVLFVKFQTEKILLLVVISVDRYYIIVKRKDNLNTFRAKFIVVVTWLLSLSLSLPPLIGLGSYDYASFRPQCTLRLTDLSLPELVWVPVLNVLTGLLPCTTMVFAYGLILRTVRRNCFRVQNHPSVNPTAMHRKGKLFIDYSYKTRTFTTISLLSLVYIMCVLPVKIIELWAAVNRRSISVPLSIGMLWFSYGHTALNPIIYTIRIKKFREACIEIVPKSVLTIPRIIPLKTRRRIRPHALYQVNKNPSIVMTVI